jgi:hypothetical protein
MPTDLTSPGPPTSAAVCDLEWSLVAAAERRLPTAGMAAQLRGILGAPFRSRTVPPIYADLHALSLPGLRAMGLHAEIVMLAGSPDWVEWLKQPAGVPLYGFDGEPFEDDETDADAEDPDREGEEKAREDRARTLAASGLLTAATDSRATWRNSAGANHEESHEAIRAGFSRAVRLNGVVRLLRRAQLVESIRRITLFAIAFPDRFLTAAPPDEPLRAEAAELLAAAAGTRRDPVSLRWRWAGELLAAGDVASALAHLADATLRGLRLPAPVEAALTSRSGPPTGPQRRELIYLARAGSRELKVLATPRLAHALHAPDVRHTLEQLTAYPDPLVRGAATQALLSTDFTDLTG